MYSFILSLVMSLVAFALVAVFFDPLAALVPAFMVFTISIVALLFRIKKMVDDEIGGIVPLLQERRVADAQAHLERVRARHGRWMPLLNGQIEAQLGMIDYFQLRFDQALPKLEKGKWRNWMALACIGAIHFRKGRHDKAWEALQKAVDAGPKETMPYVVYAVLASRAGERDEALRVLNEGLAVQKENKQLLDLKNRIANKKKIKTKSLGEGWYQFFPEDLAAQAQVAARRGTPMPGQGFRAPSVSKQMRRGR